jgi:nucleoside-diphosphate-sugar epimerase
MKVLIVGGTGFLGYYSTLEFLRRGYTVTSISLQDIKLGDWFPDDVEIKYGNVFEMSPEELEPLFEGYDAMVYSVGPDDRITPKAPAYDFFHDRLVKACGRVIDGAKEAGVKRCTVLNSYFCYFSRLWPELRLPDHHPYIKCRIEQAERVISAGRGKMDVMVLELPYIFGTMPERIPLWKEVLVDRVQKMRIVLYPQGGSNMIAVEHVAEAVVGSIEQGEHGKRYLIGDVNVTWNEMLRIVLQAMGTPKKRIVNIPVWIGQLYGRSIKKAYAKEGKEAGLDPETLFVDIMCRELFYDPEPSAKALGFNRGGIEASITKTIQRCL